MLCTPMERKDTQGFFLRLPRPLVNRLKRLADEFRKPSGNQVAVEIIEQYLIRWEEAEKAKRRLIEDFEHRHDLMLNQPLVEAKAESGARPASKKKAR